MSQSQENVSQWYKDAVIYELHVRSFLDSNGDGMGDFKGLTQKLDYLQDLGVTAVWVLPFYPSPWRDDGYDIAGYTGIHEAYGTLRDFKRFLSETHARGMRVITELVINHTSNQHPWFERARNAKPGSKWRDYYVWSDTPQKYEDARIIFKDFESSNWSWDSVAGAYYWHRFYSHQPDLNFDNPDVQAEVFKVLDFWLEMGVDGLRLDAVPYLFERENTNCENLQETHDFLRDLRTHVDKKFPDCMLLAEANQWPEDAVNYFGNNDECNMAFHFPLMPRLFMALKMEDRFPVIDILEQTPAIPPSAQWGIFLRNHDELTLEMVTDEERDYMYQVYAGDPRQRINLGIRRRLAPLLDNHRRKIELMNSLLFSLPGSPILYYGDEIGMGDNVYLGDRDGVRTPMQWSSDKNAGFSHTNPQRLYLPVIIDPEYHYEAVNVETQQANTASLLWWMKRIIATRKRFRAFSRGDINFISSSNIHVLTFLRTYEDEHLLVVVNFSRFAQTVEIELAGQDYQGWTPEEIFSRNEFPRVRETPYMVMVAGHDFLWFRLLPPSESQSVGTAEVKDMPSLAAKDWGTYSAKLSRLVGSEALGSYMSSARWFRDKARKIKDISIADRFPFGDSSERVWLLVVQVQFADDKLDRYCVPVGIATGAEYDNILADHPDAVLLRVNYEGEEGIIYDGIYNDALREQIFELMMKKRKVKGRAGQLVGMAGRSARSVLQEMEKPYQSRVLRAEQTNTSILYRDACFFKLYRKLEEGVNPEIEVLRHLAEIKSEVGAPSYLGNLEYLDSRGAVSSLGLLVDFVGNEGDAFQFATGAVERYFETVLTSAAEGIKPPSLPPAVTGPHIDDLPDEFVGKIDRFFLEMMRLLGRRTAELHKALAVSNGNPDFAVESFSLLYQRSVFQSMRSLFRRVMSQVNKARKDDVLGERIQAVSEREEEIIASFARIKDHRINARKIRIHGDYHLGQVLFSGRDFTIIDFEGEPARATSERRLRYSPLRDVAGLLRSLHYAVYSRFLEYAELRELDLESLEPWVEPWYRASAGAFLEGYYQLINESGLLPDTEEDSRLLLEVFLLEKAVYEVGYELNNRPDWIGIPIAGIQQILEAGSD